MTPTTAPNIDKAMLLSAIDKLAIGAARRFGSTQDFPRCIVCGAEFMRRHWNQKRCFAHRRARRARLGNAEFLMREHYNHDA
jgi:hypothetical protein